MISTWEDAGNWVLVLLGTIALLFVLDYLRSWWRWQKQREDIIKEIRRRDR